MLASFKLKLDLCVAHSQKMNKLDYSQVGQYQVHSITSEAIMRLKLEIFVTRSCSRYQIQRDCALTI